MKAHIESFNEKKRKYEDRLIMRTIKIACIVLAEEFGFGKKRLCRFLGGMTKKGDYLLKNPEQWVRMDDYLIDKLKIKDMFDRENLDERENSAQYNRKKMRNGRRF